MSDGWIRGQVLQCIEPEVVESFFATAGSELAENSRGMYAKALARLSRSLGSECPQRFADLRSEHVNTFLQDISSLVSAGKYRGCVRRFLEWLDEEGRGPGPEISSLLVAPRRKRFRGLKVRQKKLPGVYSAEDLETIFSSCPSIRDRAFFVCLHATGARVSELLSVKMDDVELETFKVKRMDGSEGSVEKVRFTFHESKTTPRVLPWMRLGVRELKAWLRARGEADPPDPLWITRTKTDEGSVRRMSYQNVSRIWNVQIRPRFREATGRDLAGSSHWLRHTRLTELASNMTAQELCSFAGWNQASQMAAVYINSSGVNGQNGMSRSEGELGVSVQLSFEVRACPVCGFEESVGSKFCSQCGEDLSADASARVSEFDTLKTEFDALKRKMRLRMDFLERLVKLSLKDEDLKGLETAERFIEGWKGDEDEGDEG